MFINLEAAYQSSKTLDNDIRKRFCYLDGKEARELGRSLHCRDDWNDVRDKFDRNYHLRKKLLKTNGKKLIEGNY